MSTEHLPLETLVAYWADDLPVAESDAVEEHVMGCADCSDASQSVAAIARAVRDVVPPVISQAKLEALRARGLAIDENVLVPDLRRVALFRAATDLLVHRLGGLDLDGVDRVDISLFVEGTSQVLMRAPEVSVERATGEVLLVCQRHFAAMPPNIVAEVSLRDGQGTERVCRYPIPHVFEAAATR